MSNNIGNKKKSNNDNNLDIFFFLNINFLFFLRKYRSPHYFRLVFLCGYLGEPVH